MVESDRNGCDAGVDNDVNSVDTVRNYVYDSQWTTTIDKSPVREGDNNSRRVSDVEDDPVGFQVPSHFVGETIFNVHPAEVDVNHAGCVHEGRDCQDEVAPVGQEDEPLDLLSRVIPRPLPAVHPAQYDPDHVVHGPKQAPYQVGLDISTVLKGGKITWSIIL